MKDKYFSVPEKLASANKETMILTLDSSRFRKYGRILKGLDVSQLIETADALTKIPETGNVYEASLQELQNCAVSKQFGTYFGDMPIEVGYCNGRNQTINGMEYHKSPELFVAVTDCVQFLCSFENLREFNSVDSQDAEVFFFPKGSVSLIYANVMHLAPCTVRGIGFKSIIVLPLATNEPLEEEAKELARANPDPEARLLFKKNKWMIAHSQREQLVSQGVHVGLEGENRRIIPE
jgi:hypothetical protein